MILIQNGMNSFSVTEKRIASFIIENYEEIIYMSTMQVAQACDVSDATLIRFCRKLQLSGFKDLKLALSIDLSHITETLDVENINETIQVDDDAATILRKITYGNTKALNDTEHILVPEELSKAIMAISQAKKISIIGVGGSSVVCLDLHYKLTRINIASHYSLDAHMQLVNSAFISKDDVVIGITNSGKTREVLNIMERTMEIGATTIAITQFGANPVCKFSRIVLHTSTTENNLRAGAMASRIAQLNIVDTLLIGILAQDYPRYKKYLKQTRDLFTQN